MAREKPGLLLVMMFIMSTFFYSHFLHTNGMIKVREKLWSWHNMVKVWLYDYGKVVKVKQQKHVIKFRKRLGFMFNKTVNVKCRFWTGRKLMKFRHAT